MAFLKEWFGVRVDLTIHEQSVEMYFLVDLTQPFL